jgi:glycosyltransferase involved in cell wall biosynthesis
MPKFSNNITFVIFTFNEEKRIERVIRNFLQFGPILVVDNESSDRTREIASQYGCSVLINKNSGWVEDEVTVPRIKQAVQTPWLYWGFADEMVDARTLEVISAAADSGQYDIINIARKNYYYGHFCGDIFADRMNRIFKKDAIDFKGNKIHHFGKVTPGARVLKLPLDSFVHHFISNTAKSYIQVMDRYTDVESTEDRSVPSISRLILSTGKIIAVNFLLRRGYRGSMPSCSLIAQMIYYRWLGAMKLYERAEGLNRETIELKNDEFRDRILREQE